MTTEPMMIQTGSIQTFTGKLFTPLEPRIEDICRKDIAHGLSMRCRFSGHSRDFYSVAEHAVRVSWALEDFGCSTLIQYCGLHHDDAEAYLVDFPTPLKKLPECAWYREAEDRLQALIYKAFGCPEDEFPEVKNADRVLLVTEKRDLMPPHDWTKAYEQTPLPETIHPQPPSGAERLWLTRCKALENVLSSEIPEWFSRLQEGLQAERYLPQ